MTTPERSVEEILEKFKALPVDVHKNDIEVDWLTQTLKAERQKREEMVEAERERIVNILKQSYLMTNGYKDTDNVRTCMYIENEGFNIAINKRLDFFIEQITQPNNK